MSQVKGLFSDKQFNNVIEMFKHEAESNLFNIIDIVNKYKLDMISYIKLINFIRREKPSADLFKKDLIELPWNDDCFMKTVVEDDPALQFDIEEDLDTLELKPSSEPKCDKTETDLVNYYKKKLNESETKVEELVDVVTKLRKLANDLLSKSSTPTSSNLETSLVDDSKEEDSVYVNSYSNYSIHLEMLQDKVRTDGYMNAIINNKNVFKDKVVLDVGCGSGILSLFAAKAGAKQVIACDMSDIIHHAILTAKENGYEDKIVFVKGKMEEVKLPVDKVDIIISEWMGYFLLFESMLDSVLFARDKYLQPNGMVLPNLFDMHLFGVSDFEHYNKTVNYWSDVYGFKMPTLKKSVLKDAQVVTIPEECVASDMFKFKEIDCNKCTVEEVSQFEVDFSLKISKDTQLTGIGSSFDCFFNDEHLEYKSSFSTSPFHTVTHWQQTLFQFESPIEVKKDMVVNGKLTAFKNPEYRRSYVVILNVFDNIYKYHVE